MKRPSTHTVTQTKIIYILDLQTDMEHVRDITAHIQLADATKNMAD